MPEDELERLELIAEAVRYCVRVAAMGMPSRCYAKALREPIHFLWERRAGSKSRAAAYRSKGARGLKLGGGVLVYDHAVPFVLVQRELMSLSEVTAAAVREVLERHGTTVLITRSEDAKLSAAGLAHKMPQEWDGVDPLARYHAVGIELEVNT